MKNKKLIIILVNIFLLSFFLFAGCTLKETKNTNNSNISQNYSLEPDESKYESIPINKSGIAKSCDIVNDIMKDIYTNDGKISRKYKKNVANNDIASLLYCYTDFNNIDYNEIYAVGSPESLETPEYFILKNTKEEDFLKKVNYERSQCSSYNEDSSEVKAEVFVEYENVLVLKKEQIDSKKQYKIKKGKEISLDHNYLYLTLKYEKNIWVITDVKKRYKVDLKRAYDELINWREVESKSE